jgi:hypothetical protein
VPCDGALPRRADVRAAGRAMKSYHYRVLIAHNSYPKRGGGEDAVFEAEHRLLRGRGHEVLPYTRSNQELEALSKATVALDTMWPRRTVNELGRQIVAFRPDVIHVHNTFPLMSPSIHWAAAKASVRVVQTLHNWRLACPQAFFLRGGKACQDCLGRLPWPGLVARCYRDSLRDTGALVAMLGVHRAWGSFYRRVTRYIALNNFCKNTFVAAGLPATRISVKPELR